VPVTVEGEAADAEYECGGDGSQRRPVGVELPAIGIALDGTGCRSPRAGRPSTVGTGFHRDRKRDRAVLTARDVAPRVRRRKQLIGGLDPVSHHMLIEVQRKLEEQLWMLRAQLAD
jgi:hypothetical protein